VRHAHADGQGGAARGGGAARAGAAWRGGRRCGGRGRGRPGGRRRGRRRGGSLLLVRRGQGHHQARQGMGVLRRPPGPDVRVRPRRAVRQRQACAGGDCHRRREDEERAGAERRWAAGGCGRWGHVVTAGVACGAPSSAAPPGGAPRRGLLQAEALLGAPRHGLVGASDLMDERRKGSSVTCLLPFEL
jgi:hypothetical protein